jgi:hypothetical protein
LRLGTQDARLFYHAGKIALALGKQDEAAANLSRALEINPYFSILLAPDALRILEGLMR